MSDSNAHDATTGLEVAIIGMACRFPGAKSVEDYWRNLRDGVESISRFTPEELEAAGESPDSIADPNYVPIGRVIEDENLFDATLFGFSPKEAELVDPQQRLFLECAYEALERCGYDTERYPGLVGVFAGIKMTTYLWNLFTHPEIMRSVGELNAQIANDKDYVATRLSYKLNLGGPSMTIQSACSTSLVAVHLACQALLSGECEMALAGGVSVRTQQKTGYYYREGDLVSPDGRCRAFDADAKGTIFGNGLGVVVLKRLEDALEDRDQILAVIKGSAVNNDSAQKMGFTTPGADGQERVIRAALTAAEVSPETISYLEAHGTGTPVGDPIEVTALTRAYRSGTDRRGYCAIGSVKTNIGHLASAAGIAGLIKTVLAMQHRQLPPSLNFERPNPEIDFESSPFFVNTELRSWKSNGEPLRAGISAFGIGGTNAHAIIEEAPPADASGPSRPWQLLMLSAKTETALERQTENLAKYLVDHPETPLADVAYTLQVGRREMERRRILVCRGREDAVEALEQRAAGQVVDGAPKTEEPPIAFMFSGQGAQYIGMLAGIFGEEEVFRETVERCSKLLEPHLGLDLCDVLYPAEGETDETRARLERTALTQPALFTVEYALARQWMSWGVTPQAMIGHSIGEYVAACLANVFSLEDGLALVAARGRLMQAMPGGSMLAVSLREEEIEPLLGQQLSLAALNGPQRAVVSGPDDAIEALADRLAERGVSCRSLLTSHAFHSHMMEPALAPFLEVVSRIELRAPQIPYLSNLSGTWVTAAETTDPTYWVKHLRSAVRFADGLHELLTEPHRMLIEVGPGQTLATLARQHPSRLATHTVLTSSRHPKKPDDDHKVLLEALGKVWLAGAAIDWEGFYESEKRSRVMLPVYPFERREFWIEPATDIQSSIGLLSGARTKALSDWFYQPAWKPSVAPLPSDRETARERGDRWLVFADQTGLGHELAARLRHREERVVTVEAGEGFRRRDDGSYEIDPTQAEDYGSLLGALVDAEGLPTRIAYLWTVTDGGGAATDADGLDSIQQASFYNLLYLAQAFGAQKVDHAIRLAVVSNGIHLVTGREALQPAKALALGPCKVIPQEYPYLSCLSLDVELVDGVARRRLADNLIGELEAEDQEVVFAYRGGRRFVQTFEPVSIDRAGEDILPLRSGGVYLITGGLGGIGLELSEYLAQTVNARLVLTGLSALPPRDQWDEWLQTHGEDDIRSQRIRKVQRIEDLGGEVLVVQADVSDGDAMRAAVAAGQDRFGSLNGVIHAAGVAGGSIIQTKRATIAANVLKPKVRGTYALVAAIEAESGDEPLDFLVLCSSTIAILGNFGQVDYCSANCFLDAFAHSYDAVSGVPTVAINWGAWKEVGMAASTLVPQSVVKMQQLSADAGPDEVAAEPIHPLVERLVSATDKERIYATRLAVARHWILDEHRVVKTPTLPGTSYLEMARAACADATGATAVEIRDLFFLAPLMVGESETREARLILEQAGDGFTFRVVSRPEGSEASWDSHAQGKVAAAAETTASHDLEALRARCDQTEQVIDGEMLTDPEGMVYWGAHWQSLRRVHVGDGEALAYLELPSEYAGELAEMSLHPALVDVATAVPALIEEGNYLPLSYRRLHQSRPLPAKFYAHIRIGETRGETLTVDLTLIDEDGMALVEVEGFTLKRVGAAVDRLEQSAASAGGAVPPSAVAEGGATEGRALFAQGGMLSAEGVEVFRRIVTRWPGPQVAVSPRDLKVLLEQAAKSRAEGALSGLTQLLERTAHPRPSIQSDFVAPRTEMESTLASVWQDVLGIEQIGVHDNFYELGGDSVLGIQILARARDAGVELTSEQLFQHQTIAELAEAAGGEPAAAELETELEPFALAGLDPEAIARLVEERDVEDAYPLSPLQHGLLLHAVEEPESGLYCEQIGFTYEEEIDHEALQRAWQFAVERHEILRTSFLWEDFDQPLQAVHRRAVLPIHWHDWRDLDPGRQQERLAELAQAERNRGFDVTRVPLMRLNLVRLADSVYRMILSYSHLLLDGWSSVLVTRDTQTAYAAFKRGEEIELEPVRPYRDYIEWLTRQDPEAGEDFWRRQLAGFAAPNELRILGSSASRHEFDDKTMILTVEDTATLQAFVKTHRLTLNILTQAAWGLVIRGLSGDDDVVFGIDLSGRPPELPNVDTMVGLLVNMLPTRVRVAADRPLLAWLRDVQDQQSQLSRHQYNLLSEVQVWSEVPRDKPLFETVYNFASYPSNWMGAEGKRAGFRYDSRTQFPLHLTVVPGEELLLQLLYDRSRIDPAAADQTLEELANLLRAMPAVAEGTVSDLLERQREHGHRRGEAAAQELAAVAQQKLRRRPRRRVMVAEEPEPAKER